MALAVLPSACRFHPTCSEYMMEAVEKHGVVAGGLAGRAASVCAAIRFIKEDSIPSARAAGRIAMKKELTMEVRLLIAFVLMGLVLLAASISSSRPGAHAAKAGAAKSAQPVTPAAVEKPEAVIPSPPKQKAAETRARPGSRRRELRGGYRRLSRGVFESRRGGAELDSQRL